MILKFILYTQIVIIELLVAYKAMEEKCFMEMHLPKSLIQ
jgi:hypothetical protein